MRFKKTIFISLVVLVIFLTYLFFNDERINYVVLGDSLAQGVNPYGEVGYSYSDYIKDYLEDNGKLKTFIKGYATSGYTTQNVLDDLYNNREIDVDGKHVNIRHALRESDLVTISIGANDFFKGINLNALDLTNIDSYKKKIDNILDEIDIVLREVRKYAKGDVIVVGYYNPFNRLFPSYRSNLDEIFEYADIKYKEVCSNNSINYVSVYSLFKENSDFLPNPFDIHPNLKGYSAISRLIIDDYLS